MITLTRYGAKFNRLILRLEGLSTDLPKPTEYFYEYDDDGREISRMVIQNGSIFTEIDTGNTYMYDAANTTWYQVSIGGGGGTSGGIILVGETTTSLTDEATTNPITIDGQSYTAQPNDAVIYGNKEFLFDGTKWHEFGDLSGLASKDIGAMTGYAKAQSASAIGTSDTLNEAIGKLEKGLEGKQGTIDSNNMLDADLVDDSSATHKFATSAQLSQIATNKNDILLKADTSDVNTATANLQAQIDNIVTPTTQDAEVQNARVGADGTSYNTLKARLDAENADLHDEVSEIVTIEYDDVDYTQRSTYEHTYAGLFSPSGYTANASFKSYSMQVESDTKIYCKSRNDNYFSICIYPDSTLTSGVRYRYVKNDEDTLPYDSAPLRVEKGKYIVFTTTAQTIYESFDVVFENYTIVSQKLGSDIQLNQSQIQQASTEITTEISNEYADVTTEFADKSFTSSSNYDNTYNGYADVNGITINATYKSYGITIDRDTYIYCESKNSNYFSICVYPSISMRGGTRYRFVKNGEDTLPYSDSPVSITKGQYVVFTVQTGDDYTAIMTDYAVEKTLKEYVLLGEAQINQVLELAGAKPAYIKYDETASGAIVESVDVFLPTKIGYVRYHIIHGTSVANNYDIWRIEGAYATDTALNDRFALTTSGEWEMAVKLAGNPDFSGGTTHGDEVMDSITFFVDGNLVDISDFTEPTVFSDFQFVQVSKVYNASDSSQQIATHTSVHQFKDDELTVNQTLLWDLPESTQLSAAYMAMHLPAKTVTDHCYTDMAYTPETCLSKYGDTPNAKYVSVYGDTSGVKTDFWITDYPTGLSGGDKLLITDNGGGSYNKCYYVIAGNTAWLPSGETFWKTSTHYRFTVGK